MSGRRPTNLGRCLETGRPCFRDRYSGKLACREHADEDPFPWAWEDAWAANYLQRWMEEGRGADEFPEEVRKNPTYWPGVTPEGVRMVLRLARKWGWIDEWAAPQPARTGRSLYG